MSSHARYVRRVGTLVFVFAMAGHRDALGQYTKYGSGRSLPGNVIGAFDAAIMNLLSQIPPGVIVDPGYGLPGGDIGYTFPPDSTGTQPIAIDPGAIIDSYPDFDPNNPDHLRQLQLIIEEILGHEIKHTDPNDPVNGTHCEHVGASQEENDLFCANVICPEFCAGSETEMLCTFFETWRAKLNDDGQSCPGFTASQPCECTCAGDPSWHDFPCGGN